MALDQPSHELVPLRCHELRGLERRKCQTFGFDLPKLHCEHEVRFERRKHINVWVEMRECHNWFVVRIANSLREIDAVLHPKPLVSKEDLDAWYRGEDRLRELRGTDVAKSLAVGLDRDPGSPPFKAFVMGRSGVGKSTELTRLINLVSDRYQPLRFSVRDQLDPRYFTAFDVILLVCILLAEETAKVTGKEPEKPIIKELLGWYAEGDETTTTETRVAMEAVTGVDTKNTWWDKVVGAFVTLKGGIQYAQTRKHDVVAYKLKRIQPLIDIANRLILNCNHNLREIHGKEWLILGEDADKPGMDQDQVKELFLVHGNAIFGGLEANLLFNLPLGLTYGPAAQKLPDIKADTIFDVPVYRPDKTQNPDVLRFVQDILDARMDPNLFEAGQAQRLIIASGANLRELFAMIRQASLEARVRDSEVIGQEDVDRVLQSFRVEYQKRLGTTPFDATPVTPEQRVDRLVDLYGMHDTGAALQDDVLGVLVNSSVVQEFNGKHWYGIQPLIVDVLARMERIQNPKGGTT